MRKPLWSLPPNRVRRNYRGGAVLDALAGIEPAQDSNRPEDWIASVTEARNPGLPPISGEGLSPVLVSGFPQALRDLLLQEPEYYLGAAHLSRLGRELGFLAKLLDSSIRLHVQAHPTAQFAQSHLNSRWGKMETYVILAVRPGVEP